MTHQQITPRPMTESQVQCPSGCGPADERPVEKCSREQAWAGTWHDCRSPHCSSSVLIPSPEVAEIHVAWLVEVDRLMDEEGTR